MANMRPSAKLREILEAAEAVVATAFGNTYGFMEAEQVEAIRMALEVLLDELAKVRTNSDLWES